MDNGTTLLLPCNNDESLGCGNCKYEYWQRDIDYTQILCDRVRALLLGCEMTEKQIRKELKVNSGELVKALDYGLKNYLIDYESYSPTGEPFFQGISENEREEQLSGMCFEKHKEINN